MRSTHLAPVGGDGAGAARLRLLGPFDVVIDGVAVEVAPAGQRLLALLALRRDGDRRATIAGTLWPDRTDARAGANLRSVTFRLPPEVHQRMMIGTCLRLDASWHVDIDELHSDSSDAEAAWPSLSALRSDLLPGWDETWLEVERERVRLRRLHVLEAMARSALDERNVAMAAEIALAAVEVEPLRESAQHLLIEAELALGNRASALAYYRRFRDQLHEELGVDPSPAITRLVNVF